MLGDRIRLPWNSIGLVLVLLGLILFFSAFSDYFFSSVTFRTLLNQIPALTVIAVGMTYVLLISGIDLSVGSVMALSAAVAGVLLTQFGFALWAAVAAAMLTGVICGGINGYISAHWYIPSFVVTLGMLEIARGGAYLVTGSQTQYVGDAVGMFGATIPGIGVSVSLVIALLVVLVAQFVLVKTVFGRYMVAIGTNEEAVRLSGIDTRKWKILVFVLKSY